MSSFCFSIRSFRSAMSRSICSSSWTIRFLSSPRSASDRTVIIFSRRTGGDPPVWPFFSRSQRFRSRSTSASVSAWWRSSRRRALSLRSSSRFSRSRSRSWTRFITVRNSSSRRTMSDSRSLSWPKDFSRDSSSWRTASTRLRKEDSRALSSSCCMRRMFRYVFSMFTSPSSSFRMSSFSRSSSSTWRFNSSRSRTSRGFADLSRPLMRPLARSMSASICSRRRLRRPSIRSKGSESFHRDSSISPPPSREEASSPPSPADRSDPPSPRVFIFSRLSCRTRRRYSSSGEDASGERGADVPTLPGSGNFAEQFTHSVASAGLIELQMGQKTACMDPSKACPHRPHAVASREVSAPHSLQYAALLGVRARWAIDACSRTSGFPDRSLVRVVREDLREMLPARRGLVGLRDAQGRQPHDPDILRDFQEGLHLLLVEGEDPGGPQPLTRCRHGDVRKGDAQVQRIRVHVSPDHRDRLVEACTGDDDQRGVGHVLRVRAGARELPLRVLVRDDDELPRLQVVRRIREPRRVHHRMHFLFGDRIGLVLAHALHRLNGLEGLHVFPDRPIWSRDNKRFGPVIPARRTIHRGSRVAGRILSNWTSVRFHGERLSRFTRFAGLAGP